MLHVLPRAGNGGSVPPDDYLIPAETFPVAALNQWHRGEPMHQVKRELDREVL